MCSVHVSFETCIFLIHCSFPPVLSANYILPSLFTMSKIPSCSSLSLMFIFLTYLVHVRTPSLNLLNVACTLTAAALTSSTSHIHTSTWVPLYTHHIQLITPALLLPSPTLLHSFLRPFVLHSQSLLLSPSP